MFEKLNEENMENKTKINLSEVYTNEEIKSLKKIIPDLNNIIYMVSNNDINNTNNSKNNNQPNQSKFRYYSSLHKNKNNSNISFFIDKEKFYVLILNLIKQFFEKEHNILLIKSVTIIMNDILNLTKILKQNIIYQNFFKSIKNTKLIEIKKTTKSQSRNREKPNKSAKVILKKERNLTNITNLDINLINTNEKLKKERNININNNTTNVKKQLSFKTETEKKDNNKSTYEMNLSVNTKSKDNSKKIKGYSTNKTISKIDSVSKRNTSAIHMNMKKNKKKGNLNNMRKGNINLSLQKNNLTSTNYTSSNIKNLNNHFRLGQKISLKKVVNNDNKNMALYEIVNNTKNEINLASTYQNKKFVKNKEIKKDKDNNYSIYKHRLPSSFDSSLYSNIETQEFNIFTLEKNIGRENILPLIGYYIFNAFNLDEVIKYFKFEKWCQKISDGYIRNNFYHNDLHAADITQTCLLYFKLGQIEKIQNFTKPNLCSLFFSCICHDYQHPGVNNNFLKETKNTLSIRYNDASILENMHISTAFELMLNDKECNIFEGVDNNLYKEMRKEMISCVLATDMASHNLYVDYLKKCNKEIKEGEQKEKKEKKESIDNTQNNMNVLIHSADISNPTKLFDIYFEWAKLVVEEFWDQGDKEKKLNLPCSCDREKVTIYQSQLGFINFIEIPYFSLFVDFYPKLKFFYDNLINNKNILLSMQEKEKEKEIEKKI